MKLQNGLIRLGHLTLVFLRTYGRVTIMVAQATVALRRMPRYFEQIVEQYIYIGKRSLPLIFVASIFM